MFGYNRQFAGLSGISSEMSSKAKKAPVTNTPVRDPEQLVTTENIPAQIAPASFSSSVVHEDAPFDRSRVDQIYSRYTTRGYAF
jgi:hypothetical protein